VEAKSRWTGEKTFKRSAHADACLKCHNPHGAADPQTRDVFPKALVAGEYDLCTGCHKELGQRFAESRKASVVANVRSRHPVDQAGGKLHCVTCHNPHQVRQNLPGGHEPALTDPTSGRLFTYLGGNTSQEFCLKCHDGSWPGAADIAAEVKDRAVVRSGFVWAGRGVNLHNLHLTRYHKQKCASCHDPHATTGTAGVNRGHLLKGIEVNAYQQGYPGFEACGTGCHQTRCASCHPAPPEWARPQ
jgi:predicted CXXCH cytochrome family protein